MRVSHVLTRSILGALSFLAVTAAISDVSRGAPPPAPPAESSAKVDAQVLDAVEDGGRTTFWVRLADRADLSAATAIVDWAERGSYVVDRLKATAAASQAPVRAELDAAGVKYTPFWITNALRVRGNEAVVDELAANPAVDAISAPVSYELPDPVEDGSRSGVTAVEWNIARVNAPQVWSQFGVRGEGIVVANIDSGVQYNHPALVRQYRGNVGGGSFDHNYNWWDPSGVCGSPSVTPCDNNGHGTHTMGTMVGDDGAANQIGVAPNARWIAAKGCENNNCSDASLLSAGQFIIAPTDLTGANPRPDLRPDIVNNSWGGGHGDPWYADMVDAWRAAGIFPQFSAGNDGPACGSAGSPGDYAQSYAAGAFDINGAIAGISGRGASALGGTKPDIAAPGVNVRSSIPGNGYAPGTGTSMASPHVAGTVALMWSAAPEYKGNIEATIEALDATAHDVSDLQCGGTVANNNVWGEGALDALGAVQFVEDDDPDEVITVTGTVTDGGGHGWPLYARIDIAGLPASPVFTDPETGRYSVQLLEHRTYQLTASVPGYRPAVSSLTVPSAPTTHDFTLGVAATCTAPGYTTAAGALYINEAFESGTTPAGWSVVNRTPSGGWAFEDRGGRGNLTGGSGRFAIIDSDFLGIGNSQDTDLVTPTLDLSNAIAPVLVFNSDYRAFPNSIVDIEYSTDGGGTWTNLWRQTNVDRRGPRVETVAVPAAGAPNVQVRFRYRGTWAWWWQVDNVVVRDSCALTPGGLVIGTVADQDSGDPINGATVTSDDHPADTATSTATPDDPNLDDGFYSLFSTLTGAHPFTTRADGYLDATASVDVAADGVVRHDVGLVPDATELSIGDASITEPDDGPAPMTFTITAVPAPTTPFTVVVTTVDGTARAPSDYTATPPGGQLVTFAAGQTSQQVPVQIVGDHLEEPDESFTVTLTNPTGRAVIVDGSAIGTITNDDTCTIVGTAGNDNLVGTAGNDEICGLGGNDSLLGGNGHDTLRGGDGNDVIDGQSGNDVVDDVSGNNDITGGSGIDTVTTGDGNDVVDTGSGNDVANVGNGNNRVHLGSGEDAVTAGSGDDTIDGGTGFDRCAAGTGTNAVVRCEG